MTGPSRRGFLTGSAATVATVATGGLNAPAQAATRAAAGLAAAGGFLVKYKDLVEKVGITGIQAIYRGINNSGAPEIGAEEQSGLNARILGQAVWKMAGSSERSRHYGLKEQVIDFSTERMMAQVLGTLPKDMVIADLASDEAMEIIYGDQMKTNPVQTRIYAKRVRDFFENLKPLCDDAQATVGDVAEKFEAYFAKLARHAMAHPEDFGFSITKSGETPHSTIVSGSSALGQLESVLRSLKPDHPAVEGIAQVRSRWEGDVIGGIKDVVEQERETRMAEERAQREAALERSQNQFAQWAREAAERKLKEFLNPEMRRKASFDLIAAGAGCFIVRPASKDAVLPSRAHWDEFQQTITQAQEPVAEGEIEIGHNGLSVIFHNAVVRAHLDEKAQQNKGWVAVDLPNRVEGIDLHRG